MHGIAGDAAHLLWVVWLIAFHDERLATWLHGRCHLLASMPLGLGYPRRHCANVQLGQVETHHQHLFMALATLIVCNTRQHVFMALATIINTCCTFPISHTYACPGQGPAGQEAVMLPQQQEGAMRPQHSNQHIELASTRTACRKHLASAALSIQGQLVMHGACSASVFMGILPADCEVSMMSGQ